MSIPSPSLPAGGWKRPYFTLFAGQASSLLGSELVQFALVWYLTRETGSATILAMGTLAAVLPMVVLGPLAGALVDRWDRRRVMIVSDLCTALATVGLVILFATGLAVYWHIYVVMAIRSIAGAFQRPALQASTTLMVPREQLARMAGLNQTLMGALMVAAPPLGALLMELLPVQQVLLVDLLTAALAIGTIASIRIPRPAPAAAAEKTSAVRSLLADMGSGFRYLWNWPGLRALTLMLVVINFVTAPVFSLLPIAVTQHFGGGAFHLGALNSTWGIGQIAGGLLLTVWAGLRNRTITSLVSFLVTGIALSLVGLVPPALFGVAVALMFVCAVGSAHGNAGLMALMQTIVDPAMQGRVFALDSSLCMAMMPLGIALAGPLADRVGVMPIYVAGGLAMSVLMVMLLFNKTVINLERDRPPYTGVPPAQAAEGQAPAPAPAAYD